MSYHFINVILAAGPDEPEKTIWMQILIVVILAASWGVYAFIKNKPDNLNDNEQNFEDAGPDYPSSYRRHLRPRKNFASRSGKHIAEIKDIHIDSSTTPKSTLVSFDNDLTTGLKRVNQKTAVKRKRDTKSGMELLERNSLLNIVHNTKGDDQHDITMRTLAFNELLRRENQKYIFSNVLTVYAVNRDKLYGKDIQCAAIKELAQRTPTETR